MIVNNGTQAGAKKEVLVSAIRHYQFEEWCDSWKLIRDCIAGERVIKARRETYLPRMQTQESEEYDAYLKRAVFFNATSRTVYGLTGLIFSKPPAIENIPADVSLDNVSKDGLSFNLFAKKTATELVALGRVGVMVDMDTSGDGLPYLVSYQAEDIRDWRMRQINGRWVLDYVLLVEEVPDDNSLVDFLITDTKLQYRVLRLDENGYYEVRVYDSDVNLVSANYAVYYPKVRGERLRYIPFVFFNPYDLTPDVVKPPILDIATLNISHYQSYAQLEQGRWYTGSPIFVVSGDTGDEETEYSIGPNMVWMLGNPQAKASLLEFNANGLKFLENACMMKEKQMEQLGGRLIGQTIRSAAESTQATELREKQEQSLLMNVSDTLGEGFTKLMRWYCDWSNRRAEALTIRFNTDLGVKWGARELRVVQQLYDAGYMPIEALYANLRDAEYLPDSMTFSEFKEALPRIAPKAVLKGQEEMEKGKHTPARVSPPSSPLFSPVGSE